MLLHFTDEKPQPADIYSQSMQAAQADPASGEDFALAHVRSLTASGKRLEQLSTILIPVATHYPELLRPLQKQVSQRYEKLPETGGRAMVAILAVNGLFLMERLDVGPLQGKSRARFIGELCAPVQERPGRS